MIPDKDATDSSNRSCCDIIAALTVARSPDGATCRERPTAAAALEKPSLKRTSQGKGVVSGLAQPVDEALRTVRAVDFRRIDPPDGLKQLVIIGVIRYRYRVIDTQSVAGRVIHRPTGHGERHRTGKLL